jgi:hypothetical protein
MPGKKRTYLNAVRKLEPEKLYSAADIALLRYPYNPHNDTMIMARTTMRSALADFAKRNFPREGDGVVEVPRLGERIAWYGLRWQMVYGGQSKEKKKDKP